MRKRLVYGYRVVCMLCIAGLMSCEDFVTIPAPSIQMVQENVFMDDATALAAMASVYIKLAETNSFASGGFSSLTLVESLYSDELISYSSLGLSPRTDFYFNNVTPLNDVVVSTWTGCYSIIYECNRILEGLAASHSLTPSCKQQLFGEAKFIRAFCHFYLINLFGDVPLITTSDYRANTHALRTASSIVFESIVADLLEAKESLVDNYPSTGRVRVNKGAAIALLARVYLYTGNFAGAEEQADEVISKTSQYKLCTDLNETFLKSSVEAIWQLLPNGGIQHYTNEGFAFILLAPPTTWSLKSALYNSFEVNDLRRQNWVGSITSTSGLTTWYFPYKYKERPSNATGAEYSMVLRLAEQYLIRAEARAKQNKLTEAQEDLNEIRGRAGLPNIQGANQEGLLAAIEQERRVELFAEWGHRFFDLKRTGRLDAVMGETKPNWNSFNAMLPLPQAEILINQNLTQNTGY